MTWWLCWFSGRRSLRSRRRSFSGRNVCWRSGSLSWRSWSRRSKIWRTTLTRCWCASWSRSPPSCKCDPSSSEAGSAAQTASLLSNLHDKLFSLLTARLSFLIQTSGHVETSGRVFQKRRSECRRFSGRFQVRTAGWFQFRSPIVELLLLPFHLSFGALSEWIHNSACPSWRRITACPVSPTLLLHF